MSEDERDPEISPNLFLEEKRNRLQQRTLPFLAEPDEHDLAFYARAFVYTSLPHQEAKDNEWSGSNGALNLTLISPRDIGLPYGRYPRLILAYLTTYAVRHRTAVIPLGKSFSQFATSLGLSSLSSGPRGTLNRLREQLIRLIHLTVHCTWDDGNAGEGQLMADLQRRRMTQTYNLASESYLWWNRDRSPGASNNEIVLSRDFFDEISTRPVPFDLRVLQALESTLACDIYLWLTLRSIRAQRKGSEAITWEALRAQFASGIKHKGRFKAEFTKALTKVLTFYPDVRVTAEPHGLVLKPYPPHVTKRLPSGNP